MHFECPRLKGAWSCAMAAKPSPVPMLLTLGKAFLAQVHHLTLNGFLVEPRYDC